MKAKKILKWKSILSFKQTAHLTSNWYKYFYSKKQNIEDISILQLNYFNKLMKKIMKVVILAGGLGTRLSKYTKTIPKPMVKINGKPLIYYIMKNFAKYGFKIFI